MAIMWDPPAERPSVEPTPAELAWKRWLMEALIAKNADNQALSAEEAANNPQTSSETLPPAA